MTAVPPATADTLTLRSSSVTASRSADFAADVGLARADQDGVDASGHAEIALQPPERREHRAHFALLRLQRELAQLRRRQRAGRRSACTVRPTSSLCANSDSRGMSDGFCRRVSSTSPALTPSSAASAGETNTPSRGSTPVEPPEALVDAVDQHAGGAPARRLVGDEAARRDQRRRRRGAARDEIRRQRVPEESRRRDDVAGPPEPRQHEIAQAAAHRVANQQRAAEHGHRRRHAEDDGEVGAPVVGGAAENEASKDMLTAVNSQRSNFQLPSSCQSVRSSCLLGRWELAAWDLISSLHQRSAIHLVSHRKPLGQRRAVRDDDEDRVLRGVQLQQQVGDRVGRGAIEVAGGLVAEQQRGLRISARARAARCFSPPDSSAGR